MPYIRMFNSAVGPTEVDEVRMAFNEELRPLFEGIEGCLGIELLIATEPNVGGLLDGCILARWSSPDAIERAYEDPEVRRVAGHVRGMLRQEPVVRLYEILE